MARAQDPSPRSIRQEVVTKPSVLIVDDVRANLVALEAALGGMECDLVRADSGNEALRQLLRRPFAVMLLDVQMPGMDGYEVARLARANTATREVPIIFLTATHQTEQSVLRAYGTGAVDVMFKPVNTDILCSKVSVFLELYLGRRKLANEVASHEKTLAALEKVNQALRHFTSAASHDLRAPLRAVEGFLQALDEQLGPDLDPQARDYLNRSRRAGQRMDALLNSLLAYARLQRPAQTAVCKCRSIVEQVKHDLGDSLTATQADVQVSDLPTLGGDPGRIYQLFLNLISNANKFRKPNGVPEIRISCEREGAQWVFCVADDGIGVEAAHQTEIFEAFHRLHPQSEYEGSGLGLMICRQIVEQHGGKIWLESKAGQGSKVYFTLIDAPYETVSPQA